MLVQNRYSAYRVMWLMVQFDLPTETKKDRKFASKFRKDLLTYGFTMFQKSVYIRHCPSKENLEVHRKRIKDLLPPSGEISMMDITDKQFSRIELFSNRIEKMPPRGPQQLSLF